MKYTVKGIENNTVEVYPNDEPVRVQALRRSLGRLSDTTNKALQHGEVGRGITKYKTPKSSLTKSAQ